MQTKNSVAGRNDLAHFLGSAIKRVENDFKGFSLFYPKRAPNQVAPKPPVVMVKKEVPVTQAAVKPITPLSQMVKTIIAPVSLEKPRFTPRVEPLPVVAEKISTVPVPAQVSSPEKLVVSKEQGLKGINFVNKAEQVKAEIYFRDLQSSSRALRVDALREIRKLSRPTVIAILEQLLAVETDTLQIIELVNALAAVSEDTSIPKTLFRKYISHSDAGIRLAALRAISKYKDEESFNVLTTYIKDKDPEVRRQMVNCLCWSFGEKCLPSIIVALHDSDASVRKAASQIAGVLKAKQAISGLITLLSDVSEEVQASAASALKKITKEDFEFKVNGTKREKDDAIEGWRFWWRENQTQFARVKK
ncbi:MAG: HEAT repeat domain-containing protein [Candidatus Omnitrophica bacterium]|nr:HEAT repeat domain-containing protein [Candidatus Omnitrophota bacterium]